MGIKKKWKGANQIPLCAAAVSRTKRQEGGTRLQLPAAHSPERNVWNCIHYYLLRGPRAVKDSADITIYKELGFERHWERKQNGNNPFLTHTHSPPPKNSMLEPWPDESILLVSRRIKGDGISKGNSDVCAFLNNLQYVTYTLTICTEYIHAWLRHFVAIRVM